MPCLSNGNIVPGNNELNRSVWSRLGRDRSQIQTAASLGEKNPKVSNTQRGDFDTPARD